MTFSDAALDGKIEVDEILAHHGIRGMKWGVRRSRRQIDSAPVAPEHARARELQSTAKRSGTKALTNKDLQELTQRLNLEQQYSRLVSSGKGKKAISVGTGWVGNRTKTIGNSVFDEVVKANVKQALIIKGIIPQNAKGNKNDD